MTADLTAVIAPVVICAALGFGWVRAGRRFDPEFVAALVPLLGAPCLAFSSLTRLDTGAQMFLSTAATFAGAMVLFAVGGLLYLRAARLPITTYLPVIMFPNTGNMGLPICLFAFGDAGLAFALGGFVVASVSNSPSDIGSRRGRDRRAYCCAHLSFMGCSAHFSSFSRVSSRRAGWSTPPI